HSQTNGITAPITYPAQGLLVYNNQSYPVNATGQDVLVPEGFYYFDGTNWNPISKSYLENSSYTTILGTGTSSDPYKINLVHASSTEYGVVKIGNNINVIDGVISVNFPPNTIDTNTTTTVSTTQSYITVVSSHTDGNPTSPLQTVNYEIGINPATETSLGVVTPGEGLAIADGILSVDISTIENKGNLTSTEGDESITVTNGTGATLVNTNIKVSDLGISTGKLAEGAVTSIKIADGTIETIDIKDKAVTPAKVEAGTNNTVLSTDASGNVVWVNKSTLDTDTTYSGSASVYLNETSFEREALTGDVTSDRNSSSVTIGVGDVTSIKIADGTIETIDIKDSAVTPAKLEAGTNNTVLSTDESGNVVWVDKSTLDTDTTYSGSTSVYLNGTSFEREALTGDVTSDRNSNVLTIAEGVVTSKKIADGTIETIDIKDRAVTPAKVEAGTNNTVLST